MNNQELIFKLNKEHFLEKNEWEQLLSTYTKEDLDYLFEYKEFPEKGV